MKKFIIGWVIILFQFLNVFGQSGRKINPETTPTPVVQNEEFLTYSESKPGSRRTRNISPRFNKTNDSSITSTADDENEISGNSEEIIKIETALITIPVSVFDRGGLYIPNLARENFKIFENDKEQEIAYFGTPEKPFTVILLLDTSPSTEFKIEEIQDAAIAFVNQLKPADKLMIVEFDENIHVLAKPTSDKEKLYKAIKKADFGGGTSLYDAVNFSLQKYLDKIEGRKAIILFTDGVDTTSDEATYQSTLYETEESDALIFPIYYNTYSENNRLNGVLSFPFPHRRIQARGTSLEEYRLGKKYLEEIAEQTGGRVFPAETSAGLKNAFTGIAEELRRQYNIGYYPSEIGQKGERKLIKVRVNRPNLIIRARGSYSVGSEN